MATKRNSNRTQRTSRNTSSRLYDDVLALASTLMRDRQEIGGRRLKDAFHFSARHGAVVTGNAEPHILCGQHGG